MITWLLVPPTPKADTPARRGWPVAGQGRVSVIRSTVPVDQSTCGLGASTCSVRGTMPFLIASTILITPAIPAAAWVWPMFDFTDPSRRGCSRS
ncbi:hypothetical protein KIPE111705_01970 [Kibdelosporangium persicum]